MSAILCTRSEAELAQIFDAAHDIPDFYSFNTLGQILRHVLLKVNQTPSLVRVCVCVCGVGWDGG